MEHHISLLNVLHAFCGVFPDRCDQGCNTIRPVHLAFSKLTALHRWWFYFAVSPLAGALNTVATLWALVAYGDDLRLNFFGVSYTNAACTVVHGCEVIPPPNPCDRL